MALLCCFSLFPLTTQPQLWNGNSEDSHATSSSSAAAAGSRSGNHFASTTAQQWQEASNMVMKQFGGLLHAVIAWAAGMDSGVEGWLLHGGTPATNSNSRPTTVPTATPSSSSSVQTQVEWFRRTIETARQQVLQGKWAAEETSIRSTSRSLLLLTQQQQQQPAPVENHLHRRGILGLVDVECLLTCKRQCDRWCGHRNPTRTRSMLRRRCPGAIHGQCGRS